MSKKPTKVELISMKNKKCMLNKEHALNLLLNFNTWNLPEDSKWKIEKDDLVFRATERVSKKSEK